MNRDFAEMLAALSAAGAEFLVVGAHALAAHGRPRATGDLDLWIRPTPENARHVWNALIAFGAPLDELRLEDLSTPEVVFQIGVVPARIDILTSLTGLEFDQAWARRQAIEVDGLTLPFLSREDLIRNKTALDRPRDRADIDDLERA
ncbi:MAG TPA: nucleotidyltransferase [Thermoanaerobaculia bacterium]|jgi:hypothetical protein|nr:nucleotidyltransferase [Thermoanaerobaculia bacterium]